MLINVELPITKENVANIDAEQLLKAHDMFLYRTQTSNGENLDTLVQYNICRGEILDRLLKLEFIQKEDK